MSTTEPMKEFEQAVQERLLKAYQNGLTDTVAAANGVVGPGHSKAKNTILGFMAADITQAARALVREERRKERRRYNYLLSGLVNNDKVKTKQQMFELMQGQEACDVEDDAALRRYQDGANDVTSTESGVTKGGHPEPHSRACGYRGHEHGVNCAKDCPTCHGTGKVGKGAE